MPDPLSLNAVFAAALAALTGRPSGAEGRLGVAVSGGPDSMALLDIAAVVAPGRVEAATVDHRLRPEAADEAQMVSDWCRAQTIPHMILVPPQPISGSIQAEARAARYALLDGWMDERGLDWLLTAHHADDQLETVLMRLNRASGVSGLAGIRARRGRVLRPLLTVRRRDLETYVQQRHIPYATDPSNSDERFDRVRMRARLADTDWLDPAAAARSAAALADAETALDWSVGRLVDERVREEGGIFSLDTQDLPHEYLRRLLAQMIRLAAPEAPDPRGEQIDQAILQLCRGNKLSIGACVATGGAIWTISRAPPRRTS